MGNRDTAEQLEAAPMTLAIRCKCGRCDDGCWERPYRGCCGACADGTPFEQDEIVWPLPGAEGADHE